MTIELWLSTDGKHTIHTQAESVEAMQKVLSYTQALYKKIVQDYGNKAQMWNEVIRGNGGSKTQQDSRYPTFGKRIDTVEQAQALLTPVCPIHQTPMKKRNGQYGEFYSCGRKNPDGSWCPETSDGNN